MRGLRGGKQSIGARLIEQLERAGRPAAADTRADTGLQPAALFSAGALIAWQRFRRFLRFGRQRLEAADNRRPWRLGASGLAHYRQLVNSPRLRMVGIFRHPLAQFLEPRAVFRRVQIALRQHVAHQAAVLQTPGQRIDLAPATIDLEGEDGAVEVDIGFRQNRLDVAQSGDLHARRPEQRGFDRPRQRHLRESGAGHEERQNKGVDKDRAHAALPGHSSGRE